MYANSITQNLSNIGQLPIKNIYFIDIVVVCILLKIITIKAMTSNNEKQYGQPISFSPSISVSQNVYTKENKKEMINKKI